MSNESVSAVTDVVTLVVTFVGLGLVVWQVRLDHARRRKQATIETWVGTRERRRELRAAISSEPGGDWLDKMEDRYRETEHTDEATKRAVMGWLGDLEQVSLGVNSGVFDFEILDGLAGSYILRSYMWAEEYIHDRRARQPTAYIEFETLSRRIWTKRSEAGTLPKLPEAPTWSAPTR